MWVGGWLVGCVCGCVCVGACVCVCVCVRKGEGAKNYLYVCTYVQCICKNDHTKKLHTWEDVP